MLYDTLLEAKDRPPVLDDALVAQVIEVHRKQPEDDWLLDEQLTRWDKSELTAAQRKEVARLRQQLERLREVGVAILALATELKAGTIKQVLAKSNLEVAKDVIAGKLKP